MIRKIKNIYCLWKLFFTIDICLIKIKKSNIYIINSKWCHKFTYYYLYIKIITIAYNETLSLSFYWSQLIEVTFKTINPLSKKNKIHIPKIKTNNKLYNTNEILKFKISDKISDITIYDIGNQQDNLFII